MKKLLFSLIITAALQTGVKAQCPPGAFAYQSLYPQCASGCGVLLLGWPEGVLVNIYGGAPLQIITSTVISGTLGNGGTGDAFTCVPCNTPLVYASATPGATGGCVIATIGIVPVKIAAFTVTPSNAGVATIKWTAESETGLVKYSIQRSSDGRNFTDIKTINSLTNGKPSNNYSFDDLVAPEGNNFYRLKIGETSGHNSFSQTVSVKKQINFGISIYPNPVTDKLNINIAERFLPASIEIYNPQGQLLIREKAIQNLHTVQKSLESGMYILKVTTADNQVKTEKIIKK
jgi:hypothetical protein